MKIFLLLATLFFSVALSAQDTITALDMPLAGYTLRVSYSGDTINPVPTGVNYTWNFSYLKSNAQWVNKIYRPSEYPSPFNFLFSGTNMGQKQYLPDSIGSIKPKDAFDFFKTSSQKFQQTAFGLFINSLPLPITYLRNDTIYKFPLTYGKADSSIAYWGNAIPGNMIPGIAYYGQRIIRKNYVDGWGMLMTPFGTVQAVRVKCILQIQDTLADTSGIGFVIKRPVQYQYKWLTKGGKIPYLQVNAIPDNSGNHPMVTQIIYRDFKRDSIIQVSVKENDSYENNFRIYPNPASNYCIVDYSLLQESLVAMDLFDITGKNVASLLNSKQNSGKHIQVLNLSDKNITSGIYFLRLKTNAGTVTKKLCVR